MDIDRIIQGVDTENLYKHVLEIEGPKHPIENPEELDACADYILSEFESYGLTTNQQEFKVDGFDSTFRNIEGVIGNESGPELLIASHYDTAPKSPGANDNASGVSVMLEASRVLSESEYKGNIRFVSFSLEEGNPARSYKIRQLAQGMHIRDQGCRYTSWRAVKMIRKFTNIMIQLTYENESYTAATEALHQIKDQLTESELEYFQGLTDTYKGISKTSWPGQISLMGSSYYVDEAVKSGKEILGVICMDPVGYFSKRGNSQTWPAGMGPGTFKVHGTSEELDVGDFIVIFGDKNSQSLSQTFCIQCRRDTIDLASACLQENFSFTQAAHVMHNILRSDHAPFWRANIPAILLTDTANYRYPHYHSPADTIDKLNFDFMTKICKGVIATSIKLTT